MAATSKETCNANNSSYRHFLATKLSMQIALVIAFLVNTLSTTKSVCTPEFPAWLPAKAKNLSSVLTQEIRLQSTPNLAGNILTIAQARTRPPARTRFVRLNCWRDKFCDFTRFYRFTSPDWNTLTLPNLALAESLAWSICVRKCLWLVHWKPVRHRADTCA